MYTVDREKENGGKIAEYDTIYAKPENSKIFYSLCLYICTYVVKVLIQKQAPNSSEKKGKRMFGQGDKVGISCVDKSLTSIRIIYKNRTMLTFLKSG